MAAVIIVVGITAAAAMAVSVVDSTAATTTAVVVINTEVAATVATADIMAAKVDYIMLTAYALVKFVANN